MPELANVVIKSLLNLGNNGSLGRLFKTNYDQDTCISVSIKKGHASILSGGVATGHAVAWSIEPHGDP